MRDYTSETNLTDVIDETLTKVKKLMETNTVVGDAISVGKTTIVPITKVSVGFVVGGGEYADKSNRRVANHFPMSCASGGGATITPIGFLVNNDGDVKYIDVEDKTAYQATLNLINKLSGMVPSLIKKVKPTKKEVEDDATKE